jgi:hypothetical protein
MHSAQTESDTTSQITAEVDTLRRLWSTVIPGGSPSRESIEVWLNSLTFFEVGKCIHATQRLHKKYEGKLKSWQLFKYMEQCVSKAQKENHGTYSN